MEIKIPRWLAYTILGYVIIGLIVDLFSRDWAAAIVTLVFGAIGYVIGRMS